MFNHLKTIAFTLIFICSSANAEPSKLISKLMNTEATVFDYLLFKIYEGSKCYGD